MRRFSAAAVAGVLMLLGGALAGAQSPVPEDRLALLAPLVGKWTGPTEGEPGTGTTEREYERILGARFVELRNRSTYPPQAKNPKGERHEDRGVFSYDTARKAIVFRQFHVEGFVTQYVLDPASTPDRLVFTSEAIENIPTGWRARETYVVGPDRLEETFELAEPGKEFAVYSSNRLTRVK
jgi:hypothetical protein